MTYQGSRVIVTGGLGFIGSNLALRLVDLGAEVTVIDSQIPGCGANVYNLEPAQGLIRLINADLADPASYRDALARADVVFNLAGEISHVHSMQFPERDLQINALAQLRFVSTCSEVARKARVVYAATRQVYGVPKYLPVDEGHPIQPVDFNGVHKFAATQYHLMLTRAGMLDAVVLRLTNVYGPRMALDVTCQGFLSTFIRRMVLGQQIEVFGDGKQLRDPVYVDDAVHAFLTAGVAPQQAYRSYNVGGPEAISLLDIAKLASRLGGCPEPVLKPFPPERKPIDIGSYRTDNRRITRELRWVPDIQFEEGLTRTLEYYKANLPWYLNPDAPVPSCSMPEHTGGPGRLTYAPGNPVVRSS